MISKYTLDYIWALSCIIQWKEEAITSLAIGVGTGGARTPLCFTLETLLIFMHAAQIAASQCILRSPPPPNRIASYTYELHVLLIMKPLLPIHLWLFQKAFLSWDRWWSSCCSEILFWWCWLWTWLHQRHLHRCKIPQNFCIKLQLLETAPYIHLATSYFEIT